MSWGQSQTNFCKLLAAKWNTPKLSVPSNRSKRVTFFCWEQLFDSSNQDTASLLLVGLFFQWKMTEAAEAKKQNRRRGRKGKNTQDIYDNAEKPSNPQAQNSILITLWIWPRPSWEEWDNSYESPQSLHLSTDALGTCIQIQSPGRLPISKGIESSWKEDTSESWWDCEAQRLILTSYMSCCRISRQFWIAQ